MIIYTLLIILTFVVADNSGYQLVALVIPTIVDCIFMCAVLPFIFKIAIWFDKSRKLEKEKEK